MEREEITPRRPLPTVQEIRAGRDRLRALLDETDRRLDAGPDLTELGRPGFREWEP